MRKKRLLLVGFIVVFCLAGVVPGSPGAALAQTAAGEIVWTTPVNLSNTPDLSSTDPFLLADPSGTAHLFWAEKVSVTPGNQTDTLMYSQWDGENWAQPVDLFYAPASDATLVLTHPHAILDDQGTIHLIWLQQPNFPNYTLYYSSVPAAQARFVHAWTPKIALADDLSGTEYSLHLVTGADHELHVIYAAGAQGEGSERRVAYLRSMDDGLNWSISQDLFVMPVVQYGASDTRILYEPPANVYATWTVYDETGNGRFIYFTRSLDGGSNWETPILLAEKRSEDEYERDWNNLSLLGPNQLVSMWEGGFRAYRYAMYSNDSGATWTQPMDVFPRLIGENGFVEFARDGSNRLFLFIAQRYREGSGPTDRSPEDGTSEETLWYSMWQNGTWTDPRVSGGFYAMVNPKAVIVNGNRVVAAWYAPPVYEIMVMIGEIPDAAALPKIVWPAAALQMDRTPPIIPPTPTASLATVEPAPTPLPAALTAERPTPLNPALLLLIALLPVLVLVPIVLWVYKASIRKTA